ncbi:MAG: hypothetical protein ACPGJV_16025 [Bacteriovoracaceae bacterium]
MNIVGSTSSRQRILIKKCHVCGDIQSSFIEQQRCGGCSKSFLPLNYFAKVHAKNTREYNDLFEESENLHEDDLIKGLYVLW